MIKTELIGYSTSFCQGFKLWFFFSSVPSPEMRCLKLAHEADSKRVGKKATQGEKRYHAPVPDHFPISLYIRHESKGECGIPGVMESREELNL